MLDFELSNICTYDNRMLSFFDENDFNKRDLNERENIDNVSEIKSENIKYACFD